MADLLSPYLGHRPVIAVDNPGNGESDKLIDRDDITTETYAQSAIAVLEALRVAEVDVIGRYSGGQVAIEMAALSPGLVKHIVQVGCGTRRFLEKLYTLHRASVGWRAFADGLVNCTGYGPLLALVQSHQSWCHSA